MKFIAILSISILTVINLKANETDPKVQITSATVKPLSAVTAGSNDNSVVLSWCVTGSKGNSTYEIERSFYSDCFVHIATVEMPLGNEGVRNFRINDDAAELSGKMIVHYRIKQRNSDGTVIYSNVKMVNLQATGLPVSQQTMSLSFLSSKNANATLRVKDVTGHVSKTISVIVTTGENNVDLGTADLTKGIYITEILVNGETVNTQRMVVD